jgi:hypothetical protein
MSNEETIFICTECPEDENEVDALCDECKLCADCCTCVEGFLQDGERFLPVEDDDDDVEEDDSEDEDEE